VLDCLAEGLQEFGLKVGGKCHHSSFCKLVQSSVTNYRALHYISIIESCHVSKKPLKSTLGIFPM
jgi:hypothetical protein